MVSRATLERTQLESEDAPLHCLKRPHARHASDNVHCRVRGRFICRPGLALPRYREVASVYAIMVEPKSEEEQYNKWKLLIPYLYDWFANHNLTWPSLSCR